MSETPHRRALALEPARHAVMQALYAGRHGEQRHPEALAACGRALALDPLNADDLCNFGEILMRLERRAEAGTALAKAIALDPRFTEAHHKRGVIRQVLGDCDTALVSYNRALALMPGHSELQLLRLSALIDIGPRADSRARYQQLLSTPARTPEELLIRGCALDGLGRREDAIRTQSQAIALKPDAHGSWLNRAFPLVALMRHAEAIRDCRRALAAKPDYAVAHSNMIFWMDFLADHGFAEHQAERRRWPVVHRRGLAAPPPAHANRPDPDRVLRLGYVSADFKRHSAADIFGPVLRRHDRSRFELYLYSGVGREDERTQGFRALATVWRSTLGLSPDTLARQIRADGIDILVDLSGHTAGNQLLTFLRKPAPVQVTAWGHGTGTGLREIDYFFADPVLVPPAARPLFAEEVYDLPCFITCELPDGMPDLAPPPASAAGAATFGCFNRATKFTPATLDAWARILAAAPTTRLLLKDRAFDDPDGRHRFAEAFSARGIRPDRLDFLGLTSRGEHLAAHARVDIMLDPFPANGGVSTCEALVMGVPVVALLGPGAPSRASAALLSAAGFPEWVGADLDDYVRIAVSWAGRLDALAALRGTLRPTFLASPVGAAAAYTRAAEAAFRDIWGRWCRSQARGPSRPAP